jgi:hypothetical protein
MLSRRMFSATAGLGVAQMLFGGNLVASPKREKTESHRIDWDLITPDLAKGLFSYEGRSIIPLGEEHGKDASLYLCPYEIHHCVDYDVKYIGRKAVEDRCMQVLLAGAKQKIEMDMLSTMLYAGLDWTDGRFKCGIPENVSPRHRIIASPEAIDELPYPYHPAYHYTESNPALDMSLLMGEGQYLQKRFESHDRGYDKREIALKLDMRSDSFVMFRPKLKPRIGINTKFVRDGNGWREEPLIVEGRKIITLAAIIGICVLDRRSVEVLYV